MLISTEQFTGTLQGSEPSTRISFMPPLNCDEYILWLKGSHMYYFFSHSLSIFKTLEIVGWFWCLSLFTLHSSCVAHFHHSIWVTSHSLSCPCFMNPYSPAANCCFISKRFCAYLRRETSASPDNSKKDLPGHCSSKKDPSTVRMHHVSFHKH